MFKIMFVFLIPSFAIAAQMLPLTSENRINVKVSQKDMNRIGVEGDRIAQVFGGSGSIAIETDNTQGQIFVKPMDTSYHPISLTLITESGLIQDLLLLPVDIPAETIVLKTAKKKQSQAHLTHKALLQGEIKELILAMAEEKEITGYEKRAISKSIPVWNDVQLIERQSYKGSHFHGLVLEVKNLSTSQINIQEKDFRFDKDIVAIGLNCFELQTQETTLIWVVKHAE